MIVMGYGHWRRYIERMEIFTGVPTCRKCSQHPETAEHLLFDCNPLKQVRFTMLRLMSKDGGFPQENLAGCTLRLCRLMDLTADDLCLYWGALQALEVLRYFD